MLFGIIVLVVGVMFLLQNLGLITGSVWTTFWPVLLIIIGLAIMFRGKHYWWCGGHHRHNREEWHKFGDEMKEKFGHHHHEQGEENKEEEQPKEE